MKSLEQKLNEQLRIIQGYPAQVTLVSMDEQGSMVLKLRELHDLLKGGLKVVNEIATRVEDHLCRTMAANLDDVTYKHPEATITASAKGYFTIEDPTSIVEEYGLPVVLELIKSKKATSEFFEKILADGKPLPKGVKSYIIPTIKIRRKSNGKKE